MKSNYTADKPLVFEALEPRLLLAGDVTFSVIKDLVLIGDAGNNAVLIESGGLNIVSVTGLAGTTINGGASAVAGWLGGIVAIMSLGNNSIVIKDIECNKNIVIETGPGSDAIEFEDTTVHGKTSIGTGAGIDVVTIDPSTFNGKVTIVTADGDDEITVEPSDPDTVFNSKASFNTGAGDDEINLNSVTLNGKVKASLGDGIDEIFVDGSTINGGFSANMGKDASVDRFEVHDTTWSSKLSLKMGGGADVVLIESDLLATFHGSVKIDTGDGEDQIAIAEETLNSKFSLKAGAGDDFFLLRDTDIAGAAKFDGGKGTDTYDNAGGIALIGTGSLTLKSFEVFA